MLIEYKININKNMYKKKLCQNIYSYIYVFIEYTYSIQTYKNQISKIDYIYI